MNLPNPENVTFISVSLTTVTVEDAEEGPFLQATESKTKKYNNKTSKPPT